MHVASLVEGDIEAFADGLVDEDALFMAVLLKLTHRLLLQHRAVNLLGALAGDASGRRSPPTAPARGASAGSPHDAPIAPHVSNRVRHPATPHPRKTHIMTLHIVTVLLTGEGG